MTEQLTHIDENGDVRMVDVSQKADTERVAVAEGFISMKPETLALIVEGKAAKGMTEQLTHIDENGDVRMVDVSQKADTERVAVAEGFISMKPETLALIVEGKAAKGDVLACARVAGVMAAKKTSDLIPMCHPLNITKAKVECEPVREGERADGRVGIHVVTTCGVTGKTGIEMEALTAASVACLTVYDMCKAVDRGMEITDVRLLKKDGGKTGLWLRENS